MLSLPCSTESMAIDTAQEMHEYDVDGTTLQHLRAVRLLPSSDTIETLWAPIARLRIRPV